MLQQSRDAIIVFRGNGQRRDVLGGIPSAWRPVAGKHEAALSAGGGGDDRRSAFVLPEGSLPPLESLLLLRSQRRSAGVAATPAASSAGLKDLWNQAVQFLIRVAVRQRRGGQRKIRRGDAKNNLSGQLSMQLVHVGHGLDRRDQHGFRRERAIGAAAPGLRITDDRHVGRFHHRAAVPG